MIAVQRKRSSRAALALVVATLAAVGVGACGGSGAGSGAAVARVGDTSISKAAMDHWMATIFGGDFYELTGKVAPVGVVSEPPQLGRCVAALQRYEAAPAPSKAVAAAAALRHKCEELDSAVRLQTVGYLITADVAIGESAEQGITVGESEIQQAFKGVQAAQFPTEVKLAEYLGERHWSLKDELFLVKRDLLSQKLVTLLERKFKGADEQAAFDRYAQLAKARWTAKTTCVSGYVVPGCKQYNARVAAAISAVPAPAALIYELAVGVRTTPAPSVPAN
jgi:hypothetical protein